MDYSNVASRNTVLTDQYGRYRYWHKGIARWELVRSATGLVALYTDTGTASPFTFSIVDYGAMGDGTTDDTIPIQAAIDAAEVAGGVVFFPRPSSFYKITDRLTVLANNVSLVGQGGSTIIKMVTSSKICLLVGSLVTTYTNFVCRDLAFDNNGLGETNLGIITVYNINGFTIEGNEVTNSVDGCNGISISQSSSRGVVRNNHVHATGKGGIYSAGASTGQGVDWMVIDSNLVHDVTSVTYSDVPGIQVIGGLNTRITNNTVYSCESGILAITGGNYVASTNEYDVPLDVLIQGNIVRNCSNHGIYLASDGGYAGDDAAQDTRAIVANNHSKSNTGDGIRIDGRNNVSIIGNQCTLNANGVTVANSDNVTVSMNICNNNSASGLLVRTSNDVTIIGNQGGVYDGGTQAVGITFNTGAASTNVTMVGNDFNNSTTPYTYTVTPTTVIAMLNRPSTKDFIPSGTPAGTLPTTIDGTFHVHTATAGTVTANAGADDLVVENNDHGGISILTPNNKLGSIYFGDDGDNGAGRITYDHANDRLVFRTGGTDRLYVGAAGELWIPDGITAPTQTSGSAKLFVDVSDGDLKVIFGDGTVKTIVVDT